MFLEKNSFRGGSSSVCRNADMINRKQIKPENRKQNNLHSNFLDLKIKDFLDSDFPFYEKTFYNNLMTDTVTKESFHKKLKVFV